MKSQLLLILFISLYFSSTYATEDLGQLSAFSVQATLDPAVKPEFEKLENMDLKIYGVTADVLNSDEIVFTYLTKKVNPLTGWVAVGGMNMPSLKILRTVMSDKHVTRVYHRVYAE